ncbi:MAG TPA: hypothetical protein EYP10_00160, partial [Armatimonadetes bacterium]|nr:hypothetical protein [Armatimonadota bacterium]
MMRMSNAHVTMSNNEWSSYQRKLYVICAILMCASFSHTVGAPIQGANKPAILFVASRNLLGTEQYRFLVDPKHARELREHGWAVGYATLSALTWEKLQLFNVVVLQQEPDVERYSLDAMFDRACKLLVRYVKTGGGLLVFCDLHRGRIYASLNRLLKPFGAQVL